MNTETLKTEMEKKRIKVIDAIKTTPNSEVVKATGLAPGYISNIKAGKYNLNSFNKLLNIAEKLGL